jgi:hypothetical protein
LSDNITDFGISLIGELTALKRLVIWSNKVTDKCFYGLNNLKSLELLDMNRSPGVSRDAFIEFTDSIPSIYMRWPPGSGSYGDREFNDKRYAKYNHGA